jgi:flagellar hook-length control protein FliK
MLTAITSATGGLSGAAQTKSMVSPTTGAATALAPDAAALQTVALETEQPLLFTNPGPASPDNNGALTMPGPSPDGKGGSLQGNDTALQPQITVSFVAGTTPPAAAAVQQDPTQLSGDQTVQNQYGQIITIYQTNVPKEMAAPTTGEGKPITAGPNNPILDGNNNSIPAHLPPTAPQTGEKESGSFQQDMAKENQQKGANTTKTVANEPLQSPDQFVAQAPQAPVGTENQSLLFSHQQTNTPLAGSAPTADSTTLQLPSGLTVPAGTVVDQMIAHLSGNKRLETGIVNLKLNPQELGELRMELKITQDNIKAHFIAQNPQAQEMIGLHLPRLREALEQQGLHLQQVEVTLAANDNAGREQFQGNNGQQQLNQSLHTRGSQPIFPLDTGEGVEETSRAVNNLSVLA